MDIELIIYLVFLGVALLSRLLGKKKGNAPTPTSSSQPQARPRPGKSFEDLLEEFTNPSTVAEELPHPPVVESPKPVSKMRGSIYEEEEAPAFSFEPPQKLRPITELVDINKVKTKATLGETEDSEVPIETLDIQDALDDPDQARQAIILSEIINRKYS